MSSPIQDLSQIGDLETALQRLNAERPAGDARIPGTTLYQERGGDFVKRLEMEVASARGNSRTIVTGQIGVGKSSELWAFYRKQRTTSRFGFLVYCDLEREEHPERCGATGVFLTIFRDCWSETRRFRTGERELLHIRDDILDRLIDWLKGERTDDGQCVKFRFGGMAFPVYLNQPNTALALILGKAAQHEAVSAPSDRFGLVPDTLINLLNKLLDWVTERCGGNPPLLIVDHVDKIRDADAAEDVLVKAVPQWKRIRASIIMTAPFEHTLGELRNSVESKWGRPLTVYPLSFPNSTSGEIPSIYENIVVAAGLGAVIDKSGLRYLAHYCGGILRSYVQFLIEGCKEAHLASHRQVQLMDARSVVHRAETAYLDYTPRALDLLKQITETGTGLSEAAVLLRSPIGLLVEKPWGGEQVLTVHPLARSQLEKYLLLKSRQSA